MKRLLVVFDFDGLLLNSYGLLRDTFAAFGLDVGDENRFKNRRKFLKYFGGGKELGRNLAQIALPKKKRIREALTEHYMSSGRIFTCFTPFINRCIEHPDVHTGVLSRNYTMRPGKTIRKVLNNSGVDESNLDFVIPIPVGAKKHDALQAMSSVRYELNLFGGDEVGDYKAATDSGYTALMASYGFDNASRLIKHANVPRDRIFHSPESIVQAFAEIADPYLKLDGDR